MSGDAVALRQRAKAIFLEVLELPEERRPQAAAERCHGDAEILGLVAGLLRSHTEAGALLEPLAAVRVPAAARAETSPLGPGDRVGSYRLTRVLGEGGFGVVFLAEQDEPIRRRVALKVIRPGMDTAQVTARFAAERQALALMDHPGIARVLDAGTTATGRPFFVMEFVDGQHITTFCDGQRLPLRERLQLFHEVCLAVQHAHQKGVIHRDLKPGNVLVSSVDGRPVPKVIDFGIAKAMGGLALDNPAATSDGQWVGTPECMAPEQAVAGSDDIDTRADVYGLGVLLFRLLTGSSPYDLDQLRRGDLVAWSRAIRDDEPARPSLRVRRLGEAAAAPAAARRTTGERLARQLAGELDWIVLRAMAKDRGRRYPTAAALAADVRRFLDDEPVEATPPSRVYRLGKLWRRHRAASLALVAVFVAALAAAGVSLRAAFVAQQAQTESDRQKHAADALREIAEQQACVANLLAADVAVRSHHTREASRCLGQVPPVRRGWEWHHLAGRADQSRLTVHGGAGRAVAMAAHPTQPWFATAWEGGTVRVCSLDSGETRAQTGAGGEVDWVLFTPDGSAVVFGNAAGRVASWAWETGPCRELTPHQGRVERGVFSGDGRVLATASWDRTAVLHDTAAGSVRHVLRHEAAVHQVAMTADGRRVATASWDEQLQLWDGASGAPVKRQRVAHARTAPQPGERFAAGNVSALAFDPTGRWLAVAVRDGGLLVLEAATGEPVWSTDTHSRLIRSLDWSPDATRLLAGGRDHRATLWSWPERKLVAELDHMDDVRAVAFAMDGRLVVTAGFDRAARLWNAGDGRPRAVLLGHEDAIFGLAVASDGRLLTHAADSTVRVWDASAAVRQTLWGHLGFVTALAFQGEDRLTTVGWKELRCWSLAAGAPAVIEPIDPGYTLTCLTSDAGGQVLASGSSTGALCIRPAPPQSARPAIAAHRDRIRAMALSPDGSRLATASADDSARVWHVQSGQLLAECTGHQGDVTGVAFARGGAWLVTTSHDRTVRVWDAGTGLFLRQLDVAPAEAFEAVAVHPDGMRVALAAGSAIQLTRLDPGAPIEILEGHGDLVIAMAWLPDGSRLLSASWDKTVRVWHPTARACVATLRGHERKILCLAMSPSGRFVAAGGEDLTTRVWEVPGAR